MDARIGGDRVEAERTLTELAAALAGARRPPRVPTLHPGGRSVDPRPGPNVDTAQRAAARSAVCALVVQLRERGVPPERMLVDVKGVAQAASSGVLDADTARALVEDVVRWSVEAFYGR